MTIVTARPGSSIDLCGVRKTYARRIAALRGVDLRVGRGEIFGLLGPNGAGKSTLVKIMLTLVRADAASGTLLGRPLGDRAALARVGYLPEAHRFPPHLSAAQLLDYYGALARVPRRERRLRGAALLERFGMKAWAAQRIGRYSKGMLQRLGLAQALLNDPELVVLDEPTDGLDPLGRRDVRQILLELKARGATVFLNSHLLSELEMVCDRVAILLAGAIARQGAVEELTRGSDACRVTFAGDAAPLREALGRLGARLDGAAPDRAASGGAAVTIAGADAGRLNAVIDLLRSRGLLIESVVPQRASLEDIFVQVAEAGGASAERSASAPASPQSGVPDASANR